MEPISAWPASAARRHDPGKFLADATCNSTDKNVTFFPSYGAEQRGGTANCFVVISDEAIGALWAT